AAGTTVIMALVVAVRAGLAGRVRGGGLVAGEVQPDPSHGGRVLPADLNNPGGPRPRPSLRNAARAARHPNRSAAARAAKHPDHAAKGLARCRATSGRS